MTSVVFDVPDISCEHCERAITNALRPVHHHAHYRVHSQSARHAADACRVLMGADRLKRGPGRIRADQHLCSGHPSQPAHPPP